MCACVDICLSMYAFMQYVHIYIYLSQTLCEPTTDQRIERRFSHCSIRTYRSLSVTYSGVSYLLYTTFHGYGPNMRIVLGCYIESHDRCVRIP